MYKILRRNTNYKIDEFGNIFSIKRNKVLTPKVNWDGYLRIQLWRHNTCEFISIHILVAEEFVDNPNNKPLINHKDGNKSNNYYKNLEWVTQKENIIHSWKTGLSKSQINNKKLSKKIDQFTCSGEFIKTFPSTMEIERTLGINHVNISYACKHSTTAGGFVWKYNDETSND